MTSSLSIPSQQYVTGNSKGGCFDVCLQFNHDASPSSSLGTTARNRSDDLTQQEMKSTEDVIASELNKLSVQERSKALDDLHCVGEELHETPELIEESQAELDRILKETNAPIYEIAKSQNRAYVEDRNFRLRFLRANHHNAQLAANQMIGFLSCKETYFGRDKLARDIRLDDLNDKDMDLLSKGMYHVQDGTDRNGRIVVYIFNHALNPSSVTLETVLRLNYFIFVQILGPLESVQKKGVVICYYDMSTPEKPSILPKLNSRLKFANFVTKIPIRRTAVHLCLKAIPGSLISNNIVLHTVLQRAQQFSRARARIHYGSDIELQYKLRSHGFCAETIPVDMCGNLRRDILNVWFHKYVGRHSSSVVPNETSIANEWYGPFSSERHQPIIVGENLHTVHRDFVTNTKSEAHGRGKGFIKPTAKDVLLGRGGVIQMHPGNVRFREILKDYQEEYNNTPRYKRVDTPRELTRRFLVDGVRFLQKAENGDDWVESSFAEAEKKVKQLFRSRKKMKNKRAEPP